MVSLQQFRNRYPSQLSGGQQQRVALARGLVLNPHVLLLDEPLSNLDSSLKEDFLSYLFTAHRELKTSIVYVTHDRSEALQYANRLGIMRNGKLAQVGNPQEVYKHPITIETARALGTVNLLPGKLDSNGDLTVIKTEAGDIPLPTELLDSQKQDVLIGIRPENIDITHSDKPGLSCLVKELRFKGALTEIILSLGGSHQWKIEKPSFGVLPKLGDTLLLSFDPKTLLIFNVHESDDN
jgi:ABC-type Fe3+/spermidine/putrescine transport system ATPase subunit